MSWYGEILSPRLHNDLRNAMGRGNSGASISARYAVYDQTFDNPWLWLDGQLDEEVSRDLLS